jgi:phenylacetate-CoA ligase
MTKQLKNELLYGGRFLFRDNPALTARVTAELAQNARRTAAGLHAWAQQRLHASLQRAIAVLPHYAHLDADFAVTEVADALRQFPIIDKATLLDHPATLYPHGGVKKFWEALGKTSGTTGTPLTVFRSPRSVLYEHAFIQRHWTWGGFHAGMKRATLRGDLVVPVARRQPPYWFYNRYNNQLLLSSRHLNADCVDALIDKLAAFAPAMLQAYPSTAYTLAGWLARRGRRLRIPVVFTASEPLYPHQRAAILAHLGERIMDMYGQAERVAFATECEHGGLHLNSDYSHVEIVDAAGQPTTGPGFIVGTTFHNDAQPLVRYRLSDRSAWLRTACPCGRVFPLVEAVSGKYEDRIAGGAGQEVSPSVLTFAFKGVQHIRRSQVAQVGPARWEVRVVPDPQFGAAERCQLIDNIHQLVDPDVQVEVVLRDALPETAAGKFRWVVNETADARPVGSAP